MKNSVWYHKLWKDKFRKISVKVSSEASWKKMEHLLNDNLPTSGQTGGVGAKPSAVLKGLKILGYLVPIIAVVTVVLYNDRASQGENQGNKQVGMQQAGPAGTKVLEAELGAEISLGKNKITGTIPSKMSAVQVPRSSHSNFAQSVFESRQVRFTLDTEQYEVTKKQYVEMSGGTNAESHDEKSETEGSAIAVEPMASVVTVYDAPAQLLNQAQQEDIAAFVAQKKKKARKNRYRNVRSDFNGGRIANWFLETAFSANMQYGVEIGTNLRNQSSGLYLGLSSDLVLSNSWSIGLGFNMNTHQKVHGEFRHPSLFRPDSLRHAFKVTDSRKVFLFDIPLKVEYKVFDKVKLNTGVLISFPLKPATAQRTVGVIPNPIDTLGFHKLANPGSENTTLNKLHIGVTTGMTTELNRFTIKASYQWLTPYRIENTLGSYNLRSNFIRVGVGYRLW